VYSVVTCVGVGLDLSNGSLIELSSVGLPVLDAVLLLNTSSVTLGETALVDIGNPVQVGLGGSGVDTRLEGDDELSGNDIVLLGDRSRSRKDSGEQSSMEDGEVANVDHLDSLEI
jgi:hypothetical protein